MSNTTKVVKDIVSKVAVEKVNPFQLSRPKPKFIEKEFLDPTQPEQVVKLKLKSLDMAELIACSEIVERYVERYVGVEPDFRPQIAFPFVDGQRVALSRYLFQQACMLNFMQTDMKLPYTVEDFVAISVILPAAWVQMSQALQELQKTEAPKD